jgi:hypothetical protein
VRTNSPSSNERLKINQSSITLSPALAPSGLASTPNRKATDTPAPARKMAQKSIKTALQVSGKSAGGIRPGTSPRTHPGTSPTAATAPVQAVIDETTPFLGAKPLKSRANGLPVPRPPAPKREIPAAQFSQSQAIIRTRYNESIVIMAGAFGLYLHGAATLPNPSMGDIENVEAFTAMIRGFGLPAVGFE